MKSILVKFFSIYVLLVGIGCSNLVTNNGKKSDYSSSKLSQNLQNIIELQSNSVRAGINAVSKYVDLTSISDRSIANNLDISNIDNFLPSDLSLLKRSVQNNERSVNNEEKIITLESELNDIIYNYQTSLQTLVPDPSKALSIPDIVSSETGLILGDDAEIPFNSIEGIITVGVLNEVASGGDLKQILQNLEKDIDSITSDIGDRSVVKVNTGRWVNGVVNYRWGNISESHKTAIQEAMKIWTDSTSGEISFYELPETGWNNFQLGIHVIGCIKFQDKELDLRIGGNSYVGNIGGLQELNINKNLYSSKELKRVPLHEIGHALGLNHEHRRYDRDSFISLKEYQIEDKNNYAIIPKELSGWRFESRKVRIGWWTITVYYPAWWSSTNSKTKGDFDFNSIMLYSGLDVKPDKVYLNNGSYVTRYNINLSENDIAMIKEIH